MAFPRLRSMALREPTNRSHFSPQVLRQSNQAPTSSPFIAIKPPAANTSTLALWKFKIPSSITVLNVNVVLHAFLARHSTCWMQIGRMKTSIDLDDELADKVERTVSL